MHCPNCQEPMQFVSRDGQIILHCINCGGSFLEENAINRISLTTAKLLAKDKRTDEIYPTAKLCPKDRALLVPVTDEAIPPNITLLKCKICRGIFVFSDDLVFFKRAQKAKLDYFKLWHVPLSSIKDIALLAILFALAVSTYISLNPRQEKPTLIQATNLIQNLYINRANRYLFIYFKTTIPLKSKIVFEDKTKNTLIEKVISPQPSTIHRLTTADIDPEAQIFYQIVLTDEKGNETKTEMKKLSF